MNRLTEERTKYAPLSRYKSNAKKEDLVEKLGRIEHEAPLLLERFCGRYCKHTETEDDSYCAKCPVVILKGLIRSY